MISSYAAARCRKHLSVSDPLLRTVLHTRVLTLYLLQGKYHKFYVDSLKHDVFLYCVEPTPDRSLSQLAKLYGFPVDQDLFLLYGKYVPASYEKTLVLNKEKGLFSTISYEEIPDYMIIGKFEHFLDGQILEKALLEARQAADEILDKMPAVVPDEFLLQYLL